MQKLYFTFIIVLFVIESLLSQTKPELVVTNGHIANVTSVAYSPQGKFLATGSEDRTVKLWDKSLLQEYKTLYGHKKTIHKVGFSYNGKHLLSIGGGDLIIRAIPSGEKINKIKSANFNSNFEVHPSKNQVLTEMEDGLALVDFLSGAIIREFEKASGSNYIMHSGGDEFIIPFVKDIVIYDLKTGEEKRKLIGPDGAITKLALSLDGKYAGAFYADGKYVIWKYNSGEILHTIKSPAGVMPKKIMFSKDNRLFLSLSYNAELTTYKVRSGKQDKVYNKMFVDAASVQAGKMRSGIGMDMALDPLSQNLAIAMSLFTQNAAGQNETLLGASIWNLKKGRQIGELEGTFKWINQLSVDSRGRYLVTSNMGKYGGVKLWNLKDGDLERFVPTVGFAASSRDGNHLAMIAYGDGKPGLRVVKTVGFRPEFELLSSTLLPLAVGLSHDGGLVAAQYMEMVPGKPLPKTTMRVWDVKTKKEVASIDIPQGEGAITSDNIHFSMDSKTLLIQGGVSLGAWSIETGEQLFKVPFQMIYDNVLDFLPENGNLIISHTVIDIKDGNVDEFGKSYIREIDVMTGEVKNEHDMGFKGILFSGKFNKDGSKFLTGRGGYFLDINFEVTVWDWATKQVLCKLDGHHGNVKHVWFGEKKNKVYSVAEDGFVKIWDYSECKINTTLIGMSELDYIITTPENYYKSSKGNTEGIGFRYNDRLYTFDQFDVRYNRPDKVMQALGASKLVVRLYEKAYKKRLNRMGFTPEMLDGEMQFPELTIVDKVELPISTDQRLLSIKVKASDKQYRLDKLIVSVNDVPINKKEYSLVKANKKVLEEDLKLNLSKGRNLVKISVMNEQGLESVKESFEILCEKPESKPDLYLLVIGVSEFQDTERNLKYAVKDAKDLVSCLKKTANYRQVHIEKNYNEQATTKNIKRSANFLKQAKVDDHVIVYVSSHGLLDENFDYYLATHDANFSEPQKASLAYSELEDILELSPSRNRLLFIDACHSGEVDKEDVQKERITESKEGKIKTTNKAGKTAFKSKTGLKNSFTLMQTLFGDVSKGTGATIISAAGGLEFALESDDWNNGVFTYAILQGLLEGKADRDKDKQISISELKEFVQLKVIELTEGKQTPNTREENQSNNFIIYQLNK